MRFAMTQDNRNVRSAPEFDGTFCTVLNYYLFTTSTAIFLHLFGTLNAFAYFAWGVQGACNSLFGCQWGLRLNGSLLLSFTLEQYFTKGRIICLCWMEWKLNCATSRYLREPANLYKCLQKCRELKCGSTTGINSPTFGLSRCSRMQRRSRTKKKPLLFVILLQNTLCSGNIFISNFVARLYLQCCVFVYILITDAS